MLVVAGDTAVADRENFQNIPQRDVVLPSGAGFEQVRAPETAAEDVAVAVRRALLERRPIVLNVPVEFQWEDVDYTPEPVRWVAPQAVVPDPALSTRRSASSPRPGDRWSLPARAPRRPEARRALLRLATDRRPRWRPRCVARDLFRGDPHNLGFFGTLSHEVALEAIDQSDCVIAFGASLNKWTTAEGSGLKGKKVVHVDIDRAAIEQFSGCTRRCRRRRTGRRGVRQPGWTRPRSSPPASRPRSWPSNRQPRRALLQGHQHRRGVDLRTAMLRVEEAFPDDRTLVHDGGRFIFQAFKLLHAPDPRAYVHTVNYGSIGLGMGNAVGASFGAPGARSFL